jgi:hypothetical protein
MNPSTTLPDPHYTPATGSVPALHRQVQRVFYNSRVREPVVDGVRVALEHVESGLLDAAEDALWLRLQPDLRGRAGAADDGVQQTACRLITGQIDHDLDGSIHADPRRPPDVLSSQGVALNCFELDTSFGSFSSSSVFRA